MSLVQQMATIKAKLLLVPYVTGSKTVLLPISFYQQITGLEQKGFESWKGIWSVTLEIENVRCNSGDQGIKDSSLIRLQWRRKEGRLRGHLSVTTGNEVTRDTPTPPAWFQLQSWPEEYLSHHWWTPRWDLLSDKSSIQILQIRWTSANLWEKKKKTWIAIEAKVIVAVN